MGHHVGSERAVAAGADPESVGAGASPVTGGGLVPPGGEGPGLQDQHPKRYQNDNKIPFIDLDAPISKI